MYDIKLMKYLVILKNCDSLWFIFDDDFFSIAHMTGHNFRKAQKAVN